MSVAFNPVLSVLEIDASSVAEGIAVAKDQGHCRIRIRDMRGSAQHYSLDFSCLANDASISSVTIADEVRIGDMCPEGLYAAEGLRELAFNDKDIQLDYARLPGLEILKVPFNQSLASIAGLCTLRELTITGTVYSNVSFLEGLSGLESLTLVGGHIESLEGIDACTSLREVTLDRLSLLTDASELLQLPRLESLRVTRCSGLTDFGCLSGHQTLATLYVSELASLAFVADMPALTDLEFAQVIDGDLSWLLSSKTLTALEFHPDRKHYSHTRDDFGALIKSSHW